MVTLPPYFVATKFPGYFWNLRTQTLYSVKVHGVLKELKLTRPNQWNNLVVPAYRVSVNGKRRYLYEKELKMLEASDSVFPEA
jgi:hypothetical protein